MATKIVTKNSSTASAVPTASDLVQGELAVNVADKRLFTEDNAGAIVELGTNPSTIDINAGTIDGTAIGASSASTGAFTTLTATGLDVTGTATMDGLVVDGSTTTPFTINVPSAVNGANNTKLGLLSANNSMQLYTGPLDDFSFATNPNDGGGVNKRLNIADNGDISFYEDTGTTAKFFWDASAESLGIGTSSPSKQLEVQNAAAGTAIRASNNGGGYAELACTSNATSTAELNFTNSLAMLGGNVGIGTSSPTEKLHIVGGDLGIGSTQYRENNIVSYASADYSIATSGAYNLTFKTNNAERLRIDSSGNVGIGTSSPDTLIHLSANTGATLTLESTDTAIATNEAIGTIDFFSNDASGIGAASRGSISLIAQDAAGAGSMVFKTSNASSASTERVRIDSSGNVGIGTTSPSVPVHIYKSQASPTIVAKFENPADEAIVEIKSKNTDLGVLQFADTEDANVGAVQYSHSDNSMRFKTNDSERMRIDSSGNLLVGKTADNFGVVGHQLWNTGVAYHTRDGSHSIALNRLTSDGDIAKFYKDGTTVGSIGSIYSDLYIAEGNSGLRFDGENNAVYPCSTTASTDGTLTLGASGARFKSLYLSGDVVLGASDGYIFGNTNGVNIRASSGKSTIFDTAGSERMRIDASGTLLLRHSSETNNVALSVGGGSGGARVIPAVDNQGYIGQVNRRWQAIYAVAGSIDTSDEREKTEIKPTTLGLDFIKDLKPVSYKWIDAEQQNKGKDKREHQGLIAQQVAETVEKHGIDKNSFGGLDIQKTDKYNDFHGMTYSQLIAPIIKAIQEQQTLIESLTARIAALEE